MATTCKDLGIDSKAVRAWAKEKGLLGPQMKGRIPAAVIRAYQDAHEGQ